ncbi:MAG TPA: hypothetical protein VFP72_18590 [Kineosporiaceae bacterium]|nr:hypothetical protein [Kineosporiaceae bacterium]
MFDGLSSLIAQAAVLLAVAVLAGFLTGRYLWPRQQPAQESPDPLPVPAAGTPQAPASRRTEDEAMILELRARLEESYRRLAQADEELLRMRAHVQAVVDHNEAEMGRLESGAIAALETAIASHREQLEALQVQLRTAEETNREQAQHLDLERRRTTQLQSALAERDEHLATLTANLAERRRDGMIRPETGSPR